MSLEAAFHFLPVQTPLLLGLRLRCSPLLCVTHTTSSLTHSTPALTSQSYCLTRMTSLPDPHNPLTCTTSLLRRVSLVMRVGTGPFYR